MKKKFLVLYVFLSVFGLCFLCFNPVVSADICDILLSDFDDVATGADSGSSGLFDFESYLTANYFETSSSYDLTPPNSLKVHSWNGGVPDEGGGYLNLTYDFEYISQINFSWVGDDISANENVFMYFYNGSNLMLRLRWAGGSFYWYDDVGWQNLYNFADVTRFYTVITHNGSNNFNIKTLDNGFSVVDNDDLASSSSLEWINFTYIHIWTLNSGVGVTHSLYIDNFYINYCETDEGFCDNVDLVLFRQDDEPGIRSVLLDTTVTYEYTIVGDVGAKAWLWITDQDTPSIPLHIKYLGEVPGIGILTGSHNIFYNSILYSEQTYSLIVKDYPILNPTCSNYFYEVQNFTMNTTTPYNFTQEYYAEFQYLKYNPALVGDSIDIVYCLPQNDSATNIFQDYYYLISLWRNQEMVDYKYMYVNMYKLNQTIFNNGGLGIFPSEGDYQLKVYNCSSFTGRSSYSHVYGLYYGTLFYESNELKVFKNIQSYWDYVEGTTQEHNDTEENIFSDIVDDDFAYIIGFVVCLVIASFVGYITMNGMAFASGFFGSLLIFSIPNQFFTMFPTIVLFICGLIIILLLVFMFISR